MTFPFSEIISRLRVVRRSISDMWIRRVFYAWLYPAALVLPLWLLVGWGIFQAGGWAFLWMLFLAIPSVFLGQIFMTLLVRFRPQVRQERAVSWVDISTMGIWHALIVALGFYPQQWFSTIFFITVAVGIATLIVLVNRLWVEVQQAGMGPVATVQGGFFRGPRSGPDVPQDRFMQDGSGVHEVIVIKEEPRSG